MNKIKYRTINEGVINPIELRDLAARGDRREFLLKFDALKQRHSSKSSFIGRLRNLDLWESTANETPKNIYVSRN